MTQKHSLQALQGHNLYQNCHVLGPDGILLFRSSEKKANWYLKRNLAVLISQEPLTIQLTFAHRGNGSRNDPFSLAEKGNFCVVCGSTESLSKHHVVPHTFRRHFPVAFREHQSHDVLLVCVDCHAAYEPLAQKFYQVFFAEYGIVPPPPQERDPEFKVWRLSQALVDHGHEMPEARRQELLDRIRKLKGDGYDYVTKGRQPPPKPLRHSRYGEALIGSKIDIQEFSQRWRLHFVEVMNPQYLPLYWNSERQFSEENWKEIMCKNCSQNNSEPTLIERDLEYDGVSMHLRLPATRCLVCGEVALNRNSVQAEINQICHFLGRKNGQAMRLSRERVGLTLDELSAQTGILRSILSGYEDSQRVPTAADVVIINEVVRSCYDE